ncbi:hypothetical protein WN55_02416 [Dufourea novaeangliae]|uniref:Uncharacterized protein n=1 Tax=Dufourea novaeangliae TaxID=178035 RepID=A0A154PGS7_DUFNO|nr:hypothetical protein WN55_02416 [Dufourea novaeangliae]
MTHWMVPDDGEDRASRFPPQPRDVRSFGALSRRIGSEVVTEQRGEPKGDGRRLTHIHTLIRSMPGAADGGWRES